MLHLDSTFLYCSSISVENFRQNPIINNLKFGCCASDNICSTKFLRVSFELMRRDCSSLALTFLLTTSTSSVEYNHLVKSSISFSDSRSPADVLPWRRLPRLRVVVVAFLFLEAFEEVQGYSKLLLPSLAVELLLSKEDSVLFSLSEGSISEEDFSEIPLTPSAIAYLLCVHSYKLTSCFIVSDALWLVLCTDLPRNL